LKRVEDVEVVEVGGAVWMLLLLWRERPLWRQQTGPTLTPATARAKAKQGSKSAGQSDQSPTRPAEERPHFFLYLPIYISLPILVLLPSVAGRNTCRRSSPIPQSAVAAPQSSARITMALRVPSLPERVPAAHLLSTGLALPAEFRVQVWLSCCPEPAQD
jgi:hypothetical protein